jgi:hypothetical protein
LRCSPKVLLWKLFPPDSSPGILTFPPSTPSTLRHCVNSAVSALAGFVAKGIRLLHPFPRFGWSNRTSASWANLAEALSLPLKRKAHACTISFCPSRATGTACEPSRDELHVCSIDKTTPRDETRSS